MTVDLADRLGLDELRGAFLRFTSVAFRLLPAGRIGTLLEIGCGRGACLVHLAELSRATVVGIDPDPAALARAQVEVRRRGLADRVALARGSILEPALCLRAVDLVWGEGVLHLLPLEPALARCRELLRPGGFLVSAETSRWHAGHREQFARAGFAELGRVDWAAGCWWTEYYLPLLGRVETLENSLPPAEQDGLRRYRREIAEVAGDPGAADCVHVVFAPVHDSPAVVRGR